MDKLKGKVNLSRFGLEFWLPLPLIAGGIWLGSAWLNQQVFSQTYLPDTELSVDTYQQVTLSLTFTIGSIDAEIDLDVQTTEVSIQTSGGTLQELEFELPFTEYEDIEAAIASELGLSPAIIRNVIRYRIDY
jgi:hypothetical protein